MCLDTDQTAPSVARKDITCYKVVSPANTDGVFRSMFKEFAYSLGVKYVEKKFDKAAYSWTVHKGFHSYSTLGAARRHALPQYVLFECVIPKGTEYVEGVYEECKCYGSKSIRFVRELIRFEGDSGNLGDPKEMYGRFAENAGLFREAETV